VRLCECGCGQEAKEGNRFIHGHYWRGRKHSEKSKLKMKENAKINPNFGMKGKHLSKEHKQKIREALKGRKCPPRSDKWRENLSIAFKKKRIIPPSQLGAIRSKEVREKLSKALMGHPVSEETKQKIRENHHKPWKGKHHTEQWKQKQREIMKRIWQNPDYKERTLKAQSNGMQLKPSSYEKRFISLIEKYNLPFKYIGDRKVWIGGKNPDFIGTNGKKVLIEIYDTEHKRAYDKIDNYEPNRAKHFAKYGYETIFLNEDVLFTKNWEELCLNKLGVK